MIKMGVGELFPHSDLHDIKHYINYESEISPLKQYTCLNYFVCCGGLGAVITCLYVQ